jgi:hypothetical protein
VRPDIAEPGNSFPGLLGKKLFTHFRQFGSITVLRNEHRVHEGGTAITIRCGPGASFTQIPTGFDTPAHRLSHIEGT